MTTFKLQYVLTERTVQAIDVEADTLKEAIALVEDYDVDTSDSWQLDSLEYSVDHVQERI